MLYFIQDANAFLGALPEAEKLGNCTQWSKVLESMTVSSACEKIIRH
jgi:hypothetical protein